MNTIKHIVAIDIGSNSFHLIIAKEHEGCITIVDRYKKRVSLASGYDDDNALTEEAIARALECLKEFGLRFSNLPDSSVRVVATQSLRVAVNRDAFIKAAFEVLPYPIEVIDGETEAELIYMGVAHTQPMRGRTLIIDVGGGSTELVIGFHFDIDLKYSLAMGSGQYSQLFFADGNITKGRFDLAYQLACQQLASVADQFRRVGWATCLGTSGAVKVTSLSLNELSGDPIITVKKLKSLKQVLIQWGSVDKFSLKSVEPERYPILASAVAILLACFDTLDMKQIQCSGGGLREGVLYDLSESRAIGDIRQRTVNSLVKRFHIDRFYSRRVAAQFVHFYQQFDSEAKPLNVMTYNTVQRAIKLHEIGLSINGKKHQIHGGYIIEHIELLGFEQQERDLLKLLVRYHRGKIELNNDTLPVEREQLVFALVLMRLAILCTQGRLDAEPLLLPLTVSGFEFSLNVLTDGANSSALIEALEQETKRLEAINVVLILT